MPGRKAAYEAILHAVHEPEARARYSLRERLPQMQHPILVVWGDNAVGIPLRHGIEAFQLAPNGRLAVTYGGDHSAMGLTPREFETQAIQFLSAPEVAVSPKPA